MTKLAIGILTYKRMDYLIETLNDINKTKYEIELIILNNNEGYCVKNLILPLINNKKIQVRYLWDKTNYGVAKGRRKIVENCSSEFLIIFDDDIFIRDINVVICNVVTEFENNPALGGIAFNILNYQTKKHCRYEIPHKNKKINLDLEFDTYLFIGAGMALRISSVLKVGNFSRDLGPYGFEEVDLAFRLINAGYVIKYHPKCIIEHKKSPDGRFSHEMVNYYAFVNRTIIAKKHLLTRYYISCFIIRSLFFLYKTGNFKLLIKGWKEIYKMKSKNSFSKKFYIYCKKVSAFLYY
ncbi:TPA: glycosyltransferase family 2 protein [Escherichia coli]|nr:glycosyltransferase family 2 protein [Escherichia coli]